MWNKTKYCILRILLYSGRQGYDTSSRSCELKKKKSKCLWKMLYEWSFFWIIQSSVFNYWCCHMNLLSKHFYSTFNCTFLWWLEKRKVDVFWFLCVCVLCKLFLTVYLSIFIMINIWIGWIMAQNILNNILNDCFVAVSYFCLHFIVSVLLLVRSSHRYDIHPKLYGNYICCSML